VLNIVAAVLLLVMLSVSTLVWAVRYAALKRPFDRSDRLIDRARLAAAALPLGIMLLLITVSGVALFSGEGHGTERLLSALASRPARFALLLFSVMTTVPVYLCGLVWYRREADRGTRLHFSAHVALLCALVGVLLAASFRVG